MNSTSTNAINLVDIRKLMSTSGKSKGVAVNKQTAFINEVTINGKTYRECSQHVTCYITKSSRSSLRSLVDRGVNDGVNDGVSGSDARVIETRPDHKVDIRGVDNHEITAMPLVTAGGVTSTITGKVIVIVNQHAHHGKNKTIHSSPQIEHYKNIADDRSIKVGSAQHITTLDKHEIHTSILGALPYIPLRTYTEKEWDTLPHVILTSDKDWDPSFLDCER